MKWLTIFFLFFAFSAFAQIDTTIHKVANEMPVACACSHFETEKERQQCTRVIILQTFHKHFKTPRGKEEPAKAYCSRFVVTYVVEVDSSISNIQIIRSCEVEAFDNAVIKAIKAFPKFVPAKQNRKPISIEISFPITIRYE